MMKDVRSLTLEDLSPHVGTAFRVGLGQRTTMELTLVEVRDLGTTPRPPSPEPGGRSNAFAAYFRGARTPYLPQRTYTMAHESLGELSIFIVPIGPDEAGMRYEAIFN